MKGGKWISSFMAVAVFVFIATFAVIAAEQKAPDEIVIKADLWPTPTKGPVKFTHKKHAEDYKIACADCHHVYKDGKNVWKQGDQVDRCEKCHTEPTVQGEKKLPPDQQKLNLKIAFHENCQGCHQKLKKEKADTKAPVTCTGCHPAEKKE
ncbi:MAG: cytochrome c3 family protein [Syntrophobacteraceae bacterium]|nr:cytochrome c3 family protein [Syntrophobacteraceae bacterium]